MVYYTLVQIRVALFFQPLFLQLCLFFFRARGISDLPHAVELGIRHVRQILDPSHILDALNREGSGARERARPGESLHYRWTSETHTPSW